MPWILILEWRRIRNQATFRLSEEILDFQVSGSFACIALNVWHNNTTRYMPKSDFGRSCIINLVAPMQRMSV